MNYYIKPTTMKFLKAYWMLILAFIIVIIAGYFYYDLTMQIAEKEAQMKKISAVSKTYTNETELSKS